MDLELVLKWTGVTLAWLGAALSSPPGTKHIFRWSKDTLVAGANRAGALFRTLREELRKLFQAQAEKPPDQKLGPTGIASLEGFGGLTATATSWTPTADVDTRVGQLKAILDDLSRRVNDQFAEAFQSINDNQKDLEDLRDKLNDLHDKILRQLDNIERKTARIQAHGLPVIASGIALSGVPTELAAIPALGWSAWGVGVFFSTLCVTFSVRSKAWKD